MVEHDSDDHDEQVDLDGDNDIEEMDDEVELPAEQYDGYRGTQDDDYRGTRDDDYRGSRDDDYRGSGDEYVEEGRGSEGEEQDKTTEKDTVDNTFSPQKMEDELDQMKDEDDSQKRAELLALPPHGSEVFIGGIPRDTTEIDLRELCEPFGEIFEVRFAKDKDARESKGYAFVTFTASDAAQEAIEEIHDKEYKGRTLRCSLSQAKYRLFIGNIPKSLTDEDLRKILDENGPGVENIELLKDAQNPTRNRGFVFVEYYNHACADYSRQKMSNPNFKMDGSTPTVSWADPKNSDSSASTQVKAVYVKNLPENVSTDKLKELFGRHGEITKVVLPPAKSGQSKSFGFIYFEERSSALKAVKPSEKYEIDGQVLEAVLAKPQADRRAGHGANSYKPGLMPSHSPYPYGMPPDPYGSFGGYGGSGYGQPVIYGRGPMPAGMRMVPMVLPDGRLGYVLQQPGSHASMPPPPPPRRRDRSGGSSDRGGRGNDGGRGQRYRPY